MKIKAKYTPQKLTTIAYAALICIGVLLVIGRWYSVFNENFFIITEEINSHISNFSISLIFYLAIGYLWLLFGVKIRNIAILGFVIMIANFICETLMTFMNTTDIIDAIYGSIGTILGFVFLLLADKYGLQKNDALID